ncbi:hypothetical protein NH340_JMT02736 [Sarcoptes scabiei]|nr:hypothetical protein NH340_JMT02736 [Sarcoptes scabiei]
MIPKAISMEIRHIIVLMIVFTIYVIVGGMVFMILERSEERSKRLEIEISLNSFKERISRLNDQNLTAENFNEIIKILLKARDDNLIDSDGNQHAYINWNFINSFFFAITVITTIGYGHLTPSTIIGKIFCIVYALFGIPITSLLIGGVADHFSRFYTKRIAKNCHRNRVYEHLFGQISARISLLNKALISLVPWLLVFLILPALIFSHLENWSFLDGFYFCFVTLSTIGFGDFVTGSSFNRIDLMELYKLTVIFWIIFGLAYLSMVLNFISDSLRKRRISKHVMQRINSLKFKMKRQQQLQQQNKAKISSWIDSRKSIYERQQSSPTILIIDRNNSLMEQSSFNPSLNQISEISDEFSSVTATSDSQPNFKNDHNQSLNFWKRIKSFWKIRSSSPISQSPLKLIPSTPVRQSKRLPLPTPPLRSSSSSSFSISDYQSTPSDRTQNNISHSKQVEGLDLSKSSKADAVDAKVSTKNSILLEVRSLPGSIDGDL